MGLVNNRPCPFCGELITSNEYSKANANHILVGFKFDCSMKKCGHCGSLYLNYVPTRVELQALYSKHFRYSTEYSRGIIDQYKKRLKKLLKIGTPPNACFLEIGCAGGNWLMAAKELGWSAAGNDLNDKMLEQVSKEVGVETFLGFFEDVNFNGKKFDTVIAMNVFEHLIEPHALIAKLATVMVCGGLFMMKTPIADTPAEKFEGEKWIHLSELGHIQFGSKRAILEVFQRHGFELVSYENAGFIPRLSAVIHRFRNRKSNIGGVNFNVEADIEEQNLKGNNIPPVRSKFTTLLAKAKLVKPVYFYILNLLGWGDSSYWIFRKIKKESSTENS